MIEDERGSIYLEVIQGCVFLHTMIIDLQPLRMYKQVLRDLETELLMLGVNSLGVFVEKEPKYVRFAEFFGFKITPYENTHDQWIMKKDLRDE